MDYQEILASLPRLGHDQLVEIRKRCQALISFGGGNSKEDLLQDPLLDALLEEVRSIGLEKTIPHPSYLRQHAWYKVYAKKVGPVRDFLEAAIPNMTQVERYALYAKAARCLRLLLEKRDRMRYSTMLFFVDWIPEALNQQYPRYIANGMLKQLLRSDDYLRKEGE